MFCRPRFWPSLTNRRRRPEADAAHAAHRPRFRARGRRMRDAAPGLRIQTGRAPAGAGARLLLLTAHPRCTPGLGRGAVVVVAEALLARLDLAGTHALERRERPALVRDDPHVHHRGRLADAGGAGAALLRRRGATRDVPRARLPGAPEG